MDKGCEERSEYLLYDEPMGLVSGVQTQLRSFCLNISFYDVEDVETYLDLMESVPDYFESLTEF